MILGFSGTRQGMWQDQILRVRQYLERYQPGWLHHGMCQGADAQVHMLAGLLGWKVHGHPPVNKYLMMKFDPKTFHAMSAPGEYLERNRHIVDACDEFWAAPIEKSEQRRGGTWSAIRYARMRRKKLTIFWANGEVLLP
jgi:hypothetical protein